MVDDKNYIYGVFNESFAAGRFFPHELCLYGYNDETESFLVKDFTFSGTGRFTESYASYSDIANAFHSISSEDDYFLVGRGGLVFLKYYPDAEYAIEQEMLREDIENYLTSTNISKLDHLANNRFLYGSFGLDIYDRLITNLNDTELGVDIRVFAVFSDHKKMLSLRAKYLSENGMIKSSHLIDGFDSVYKDSQVLLSQAIKMSVSKNNRIELLIDKLTKMKEQEKESLAHMLELL